MNTGFKHVYGPVPSRRLGRSLGVDALTFKSCSFDCVYCQLGRTTNHTIERKEYIPTADILDEVRRKLENGDKPEYISFAGSGEPTLHSGLGDIIRGIKAMTDVPVVVFTNGSLLWMPEVRADLAAAADEVIPSLDRGDAALLDKVQINSVCRPPAETYALPVPAARLLEIRKHFAGVPGTIEIIAEHLDDMAHTAFRTQIKEEDILALIERRPCTAAGAAAGLNIHVTEAIKHLEMLVADGKAVTQPKDGQVFYSASELRTE